MRFKWRRRLAVTAFALGSMLPFAGCSSQQQQATDEVAAEGQGGEQGGGQETDQTAAAQGQSGDAEAGGAATAQEQAAPSNDAPADNSAGSEVAENAAPAGDGGDVQEIMKEMNGQNQGQPMAEEAAPVAEGAAPVAEGAAPVASDTPAEGAPAAEGAAPVASAVPASEAGAPAAVAGMPEMGSKMAYVVEAGDTLGKIAAKIYGDQKRWRDIANLSGMENPNHIYPGDIVYYSLDDGSRNFASSYESVRRAKEVVRDGDTLAAISQRVYGTSKAWRHIWRQNDNIDNPDVLTAGMSVYYVEKGAFKAAMSKAKSSNFAKASGKVSKTVFKAATAKTVAKSNVTAQAFAFVDLSV